MAAMTPDQRYAQIVRAFLRRPGISQQGRGFGSTALKVRGKMFATLSPAGALVVKLPVSGPPRWPTPDRAGHSSLAPGG